MRLISRLLGVVVLVIVVTLGILPYVCGYIFKQNYLQLIDSFNRESSAQIKIDSYEQGWLSSNVKLTISPSNIPISPTGPRVKADFTIDQTIQHGPLLKSNNTWSLARAFIHSVINPPAVVKLMLDAASFTNNINVNTVVTLGGDYQTQYSLAPSTSALGKNSSLSWNGFSGNIDLGVSNNQIQKIHSKSIIGELTFQDEELKLRSQALTLENNLSRDKSDIFIGGFTIQYPGFNFLSNKNINASLSNLTINAANNLHETNLLDHTLTISVTNITTPEIIVNPSTIKLSILNLNAQGYINFKSKAQDISKRIMSNEPDFHMLAPLYLPLISPTTIITENINIATNQGKLIANGEMNFIKDVSGAKSFDEFIAYSKISASIRISSSLVNNIINNLHEGDTKTTQQEEQAQSPHDKFTNNVQEMSSQGVIKQTTAYEIIDAANSNPAINDFNSNLDLLVGSHDLSPEIAAELKQGYANMQQAMVTPQNTAITQTQLPDSNQKMLQDFVSQGFITKENDDYITQVTYENGVLRMNGKEVSPKQ